MRATLRRVSSVSDRSAMPAAGGAGAIRTDARRSIRPKRIVEIVVALNLASAILMAPLLGLIHVHRAIATARLSRTSAMNLGAKEAGLDPTVFDRLSRVIPPDATYWVDTSSMIRPSVTRQAFPLWASGSLLPRVAVAKPAKAEWVVIWGYSPKRRPVETGRLQVVAPRVPPRLPVYVARVIR